MKSLDDFVVKNELPIYVDNFVIDDSNLYVSFAFNQVFEIGNGLKLSFVLVLENDEIKRNAVSFSGVFKLTASKDNRSNDIYLKPTKMKFNMDTYQTDLLTYPHRGSVENVIEKVGNLPLLIDKFIAQVTEDAKRISNIKNPEDVKKLISDKVKFSKKAEFQNYKDRIRTKLASINVNNTFQLFHLLREVEELFEHDDVISVNFWRNKLYEALIEKE